MTTTATVAPESLLPCGCPDTSLETLRGYLTTLPKEDPLTACVVAAFNRPDRGRASMRRLLALFVPGDVDHAWVWQAFEAGARVSARLLTGAGRPDMVLVIDRGGQWLEAAAVVEVKIGAEFNVPELRQAGANRWAELGLRPHLKLWKHPESWRPGVPQTDTYALFPFETDGCLPDHSGPGDAIQFHGRDDTAMRLLYPKPVPAAAAVSPSVTGHLWQTTTFEDLAAALMPASASERDTGLMAWDRALSEVLTAVRVATPYRPRPPRLDGLTAAQVTAARAAAVTPSQPLTAASRPAQQPAYDPKSTALDALYTLQVEWDHHKAAVVTPEVLSRPSFRPWSYTTVPTTIEWQNDAGEKERDETTGRPFRDSYDELAHRFILREGSTRLRRLEVHAGIGHAARFGWREAQPVERYWPGGFPAGAGHLVVTVRDPWEPLAESGPQRELAETLLTGLAGFGVAVHDVRSADPHERICVWLTYPPFPTGRATCEQHRSAAGCQHSTTDQLVAVTSVALPLIAQYAAYTELDRTPPYPLWQGYQD